MHKLIFLSDMATIFKDQLNLPLNKLDEILVNNGYEYDEESDRVCCLINEHIEIPFLIMQDESRQLETENFEVADGCIDNRNIPELKVDFLSVFKQLSSEHYKLCINLYEIKDVNVKLARHVDPSLIDEYYLRTEAGFYPDLLRRVEVDKYIDNSYVSFKLNPDNSRYILDLAIKNKDNDAENTCRDFVCGSSDEVISGKNIELKFFLKQTDGEKNIEAEDQAYSFTFFDRVLDESSYKHTEWFHCDCLADYYKLEANSDEYFKVIRNFAAAGRAIHMNTIYVPVFTPALDVEYMGHRSNVQLLQIEVSGDYLSPACKYKFDFTYLKKYLQIMLDLKYQYFEICHLFSQWGAKFAIDVYAKVNGEEKRIFDNSVEAMDERYIRFIKKMLAELNKVLEEFDIRERTFFHISDEPDVGHLDNYKKIIEALDESLNGVRRIDALSHSEFFNNDLIKEPVIALNFLSKFISDMKDEGNYWIYYCISQAKDVCNRFMSMPICRQRSLALILYLQDRAIGFLHWGFNFYNSQFSLEKLNPYESVDAGGKFVAGDAFLFYPGNDYLPEWSIRAMTMRRIFEDLAKLELLQRVLGREKLKEEIEAVFDYSKKEFSFAKTAREFKLVKSKINQLLEENINRGK